MLDERNTNVPLWIVVISITLLMIGWLIRLTLLWLDRVSREPR